MSTNLKTFLAIFFLICGVVGIVLCVVNLTQQPIATTYAIVFGVIGVRGLILGGLTIRKPKY